MSGTNFGSDGSYNGSTDPGDSSVGSLFDASVSLGMGTSYYTPKSADTSTGDAVDMMAPVTAQNTVSDSNYSGFWNSLGGALNGAIGTATKVYAARNGVVSTTSNSPVAAPPNSNGKLLLLVVGVVAVVLLTRKA